MESGGEWYRQRTLQQQRNSTSSSVSNSRMHRFMPPPASYDTLPPAVTATSDANQSQQAHQADSHFSTLLADDVTDHFTPYEADHPHTATMQDVERGEAAYAPQPQAHYHQPTFASSNSSIAAAPATWTPVRPVAQSSHVAFAPSTYYAPIVQQQIPVQPQPNSWIPHQSTPHQQQTTYITSQQYFMQQPQQSYAYVHQQQSYAPVTTPASAAPPTSSTTIGVRRAAEDDSYSVSSTVSSSKRQRTSASNHLQYQPTSSSSSDERSSSSTHASTPQVQHPQYHQSYELPASVSNAQPQRNDRSRKKFSKSHQSASNRQIVQTQAVAHVIPRTEEEIREEQELQAQMEAQKKRDEEEEIERTRVREELKQQHQQQLERQSGQETDDSAPSSRAKQSARAQHANESSDEASTTQQEEQKQRPIRRRKPQQRKRTAAKPRTPSPDTTVAAAASSSSNGIHATGSASSVSLRWTGSSPHKATTRRGAAVASSSSSSSNPPVIVHNIGATKPLSETGVMWVRDYTKSTTPVMTPELIDERIKFLEQQVSSANLTAPYPIPRFPNFNLTPAFFTMALSLLIRQEDLSSEQCQALITLIDTGVKEKLVPPALNIKFTEHFESFAKAHIASEDLQATHHVEEIKSLLTQQLQASLFGNAQPNSYNAPNLTPMPPAASSNAARPPQRTNSHDEFHMLGSSRHGLVPIQCGACGLSVLGAASMKLHVKSCVKHRLQKQAAALRTQQAMRALQQAREMALASSKRVPALSSSFVPAASSSSAFTASGATREDAISIGDDEDETSVPTMASRIAHIVASQRLLLTDALAFIRASFAGDDLIESQKLPLVDPLTLTRIDVPVRSKACSHVRCMDLSIFLEHADYSAHEKKALTCTVCGNGINLRDLIVDSFLELRLKEAASMPDVQEMTLHRDTTFDFGSSGATSSAAAASLNTNTNDAGNGLTRQSSDGKKGTKHVTHVDLLGDTSDEEEEDEKDQPISEPSSPRTRQRRRVGGKEPRSSPTPAVAATGPRSDHEEDGEPENPGSPVRSRSVSPARSAVSSTNSSSAAGASSSTVSDFKPLRSPWNRPEVWQTHRQPKPQRQQQSSLHLPLTSNTRHSSFAHAPRPRATLTPASMARAVSAREADVDLTLSSDAESDAPPSRGRVPPPSSQAAASLLMLDQPESNDGVNAAPVPTNDLTDGSAPADAALDLTVFSPDFPSHSLSLSPEVLASRNNLKASHQPSSSSGVPIEVGDDNTIYPTLQVHPPSSLPMSLLLYGTPPSASAPTSQTALQQEGSENAAAAAPAPATAPAATTTTAQVEGIAAAPISGPQLESTAKSMSDTTTAGVQQQQQTEEAATAVPACDQMD